MVGVVAMAIGRYPVPVGHVVEILVGQVTGQAYSGPVTAHDVVMLVRLPRVLLGALVGGGLAVGGVALQAAFRNPLTTSVSAHSSPWPPRWSWACACWPAGGSCGGPPPRHRQRSCAGLPPLLWPLPSAPRLRWPSDTEQGH